MGSRGRSIRLRIYFLVAVPLVTMVGLLAYVSWTTVDNAINLDRAPNLIHATSEPAARFIALLQSERRAAVVYLFQPNEANAAAYDRAVKATDAGLPAFRSAMTSADTLNSTTPDETRLIDEIMSQVTQTAGAPSPLAMLRAGVVARMLAPGKPMTALDALEKYNGASAAMVQLFVTEADSMTNTVLATQALGLINTVASRDYLSQEDALLAGMLAAGRIPPTGRAAFSKLAGMRAQAMLNASVMLTPANNQVFSQYLAQDTAQQDQLAAIEGAVAAGAPASAVPVTPAAWHELTGKLLTDNFNGGTKTADAELTQGSATAHSAWWRFAISSGAGLLGLVLTIILTTIAGRGIIKRLRQLETSALTLAENQLPDVIGRLRRGEDVDIATEAPPLRVGGDEIGRVGQAFDLVRQTAIRAAVEEARLRRGLNDVFRSLARRSQSLLHRQLTLLDQMERRATDPEALDDLFRLDHLTTRMRRHAEGLVILAGGPAGRGWSSPVRMVDVMRGAIAEVEDYARVSVVSKSQASLAGSAVADVIHLLAELIENATTLSPPYTSVRVSGETVGNGFAIEVEDRGLGMSQHRLAELNDRLANPPEFNPSDSEQLGLFVVGQLAKRHGIRVTLKASPYGGTEAVVLIPRQLVVADEAFRSLPGGVPVIGGTLAEDGSAAIPAGELTGASESLAGSGSFGNGSFSNGSAFGNGSSGNGSFGNGASFPGTSSFGSPAPFSTPPPFADAPGTPSTPGGGTASGGVPAFGGTAAFGDSAQFTGGPRISGPMRRSRGESADSQPHGAHHAPRRERGTGSAGNGFPPNATAGSETAGHGGGSPSGNGFGVSAPFSEPSLGMTGFSGTAAPPGPVAQPERAQDTPPGELPRRTRGQSSGGGAAAAAPAAATPFDVFQPRRRGEEPAGQEPAAGGAPSSPFGTAAPYSAPFPAEPAAGEPADGAGQSDGEHEGLPRRVRQASLAPQLRTDPAFRQRQAAAAAGQGASAPESGGPSPEEIRATMSALQRGWQEGRSQSAAEGEPPWQTATEGGADGTPA